MTVKKLIEKLKEFNENAEVGGSGNFGELLDICDVGLTSNNYVRYNEETKEYDPVPRFVVLTIEWAGNVPD